jgi:SOS-response transcriptional repressor LexA
MRLTPRQQEVLDALRQHAADSSRPPALDTLCAIVGLRSRRSLHKHVQALIRGEETTLKRILQEPGRVTLLPANRKLSPAAFAPEDVAIQGAPVGQMRSHR